MSKIDLWEGLKKEKIGTSYGALYHDVDFAKEGYCLLWTFEESMNIPPPLIVSEIDFLCDMQEWIEEVSVEELMEIRYQFVIWYQDHRYSRTNNCIIWTTQIIDEEELPLTIYSISEEAVFEDVAYETYEEPPNKDRFPYGLIHFDEGLSGEAKEVLWAMRRLVDLDYPLTICTISNATDMDHFVIKTAIDEIEDVTNFRMREYDEEKRKYRLIKW